MSKKIVFQINVPNHFQNDKLTAYTYMQDMYSKSQEFAKKYARRVCADYYCITKADDFFLAKNKHLDYQKLKMYDFTNYDQILYLDSDYIIKENAPDIFEICNNKFGAATDNGKSAYKYANELQIPIDLYFNAGIMHVSKEVLLKTKDALEEYLKHEYTFDGQGLLNKLFYDYKIDRYILNSADWNPVSKTFGNYADHYAGKKKSRWGKIIY